MDVNPDPNGASSRRLTRRHRPPFKDSIRPGTVADLVTLPFSARLAIPVSTARLQQLLFERLADQTSDPRSVGGVEL